jgi:hypothetical protein
VRMKVVWKEVSGRRRRRERKGGWRGSAGRR